MGHQVLRLHHPRGGALHPHAVCAKGNAPRAHPKGSRSRAAGGHRVALLSASAAGHCARAPSTGDSPRHQVSQLVFRRGGSDFGWGPRDRESALRQDSVRANACRHALLPFARAVRGQAIQRQERHLGVGYSALRNGYGEASVRCPERGGARAQDSQGRLRAAPDGRLARASGDGVAAPDARHAQPPSRGGAPQPHYGGGARASARRGAQPGRQEGDGPAPCGDGARLQPRAQLGAGQGTGGGCGQGDPRGGAGDAPAARAWVGRV
mmetsp:Transcript_17236/g.56406  ORF Transcript_17236/g.56406 Transcript_17236/m.56406 type:complete len:266 (+) Transcript_17236:223-1020(+)